MSKEDLTLIELKNVIDEFKNNDTNEYLYWGNNRNYKLYRTIIEGSEIKEFKQRIISTIELALENRVINNYDLECSFDDVIELYPSKDVENYNIINEKIKKDEVADIKQETNLENMNFNIFRMKANYGEEKEITIIKKFNKPGMVLKQAMKFAWLGDRMKKIDEDVIYLDGQVDAFEYDGSFFILNRDRFNSIFKFKDMYCKLIEAKEEFIVEANFIDNPEKFIKKCKENGHYVKRISKVIVREGFENLEKNKHKLKDVIEKHKLGIKIDENNRIIYEEDKIDGILNLLLDHCVISELSDKRAIAKALDYEKEE